MFNIGPKIWYLLFNGHNDFLTVIKSFWKSFFLFICSQIPKKGENSVESVIFRNGQYVSCFFPYDFFYSFLLPEQ